MNVQNAFITGIISLLLYLILGEEKLETFYLTMFVFLIPYYIYAYYQDKKEKKCRSSKNI